MLRGKLIALAASAAVAGGGVGTAAAAIQHASAASNPAGTIRIHEGYDPSFFQNNLCVQRSYDGYLACVVYGRVVVGQGYYQFPAWSGRGLITGYPNQVTTPDGKFTTWFWPDNSGACSRENFYGTTICVKQP